MECLYGLHPIVKIELNCQSVASLCCRRVSLWANHGEGWSLASGTSKLKHCWSLPCDFLTFPQTSIFCAVKSSVSPARTACFLPDISYETRDALYTSKLPVLHFGKCTLAVPSISLHFSAGKSTSPFNYQLHAFSWTCGRSPNKDAFMPGKSGCLNGLEYFCFWWKRAVALSHGRERFKEGKLFSAWTTVSSKVWYG